MSRKLVTIRKISNIKPIEGADRIVAYQIDGWWVIDQKDKYKINDLVVYIEIDAWVPTILAPFLSRDKEPREFNGVNGEKLKTIKLKGQLSQGLLLPLNDNIRLNLSADDWNSIREGIDYTEELGVQLWERSIRLNKYGQPIENREARKGGFPIFIPKSDQERVQNCTKQFNRFKKYSWEVTEKLDGSSMTVYIKDEDRGVCSRNINLKGPGIEDREDCNNIFWRVALRDNLFEFIEATNRNLAIQGELVGPGIQGNPYKLKNNEFYLYNIWDIDNQCWLNPDDRSVILSLIHFPIKHVPILVSNYTFREDEVIDSLLELSEGNSVLNLKVKREGLVFKANCHSESFKVISNSYLLN